MGPIDWIARLPLFQGLARRQWEELARIVAEQSFRRGETIFLEGDKGTGFYVVLAGRVKIFKLSAEGKEQILHIFGPGEPFGEAAVFAGQPFPAHAQALEDTRLFFFPRQDFIELIRRDPSLALNMLAELSKRLRRFTSLIESLSLKEVPGRLAAYILLLSERQESAEDLDLDVSKSQLASLLGTIPETLSRILARMSKEGLIELSGPRRIRLLDRAGLEDLASGERRLA